MKKLLVFVVAVLAILFSAHLYAFAGNGKAGENRQLKGFERIRLVGSPDIKYIQGKTWSVRVKAPQKVMKKVETRVEGNCLVVSMKDHSIFSLKTIKGGEVTVYVNGEKVEGFDEDAFWSQFYEYEHGKFKAGDEVQYLFRNNYYYVWSEKTGTLLYYDTYHCEWAIKTDDGIRTASTVRHAKREEASV